MNAEVERVRLICDTCHKTIYDSCEPDDGWLMRHREAMKAAVDKHQQRRRRPHKLRVKIEAVA